MIDIPMFQDDQYGYVVIPPGWVPHNGDGMAAIENALVKLCAKWKPVEGKRVVGKIMEYYNVK